VKSFKEKLEKSILTKNSNLCVGIDIDKKYFKPDVTIQELKDYSFMVVSATKDVASAYKPNLAFFEEWGSEGFVWLEELVKEIGKEHIIIADAKRGDIGNTANHYANAFFNHFKCDAITVNPYMGKESIEPFCLDKSKGVYVLCRTSNPSASFIQKNIYEKVIKLSKDLNQFSNIGLVVGATDTESMTEVRGSNNLPFLVPGIGAQGGSLKDVIKINKNHAHSTLINISRSIIFPGNNNFEDIHNAAHDFANQMRLYFER
jgi:orotidine-5'-phosphate decarboxylase|tara:strand:+ start:1558 stop:2337 length:780 start_codon:yes stop_codon:yes gene_type:complete